MSIVVYKDGNALTPAQMAKLKPGEGVKFAYAPGGKTTKVRFRVNGGQWNVTSTKNSKGQFVWDYKITEVRKYTIEGQWFDGSAWH